MTTYTEAQYSTPAAYEMIKRWLNNDHSNESVEIVARYMSKSLRIGNLRVCRALIRAALAA
jgi:hypothetical protein